MHGSFDALDNRHCPYESQHGYIARLTTDFFVLPSHIEMEIDANGTSDTMILRLCLRIGLFSPWTSFAAAEDASGHSVGIYRQIFLPTCEIRVSSNFVQEFSLLFGRIARYSRLESTMRPQHGKFRPQIKLNNTLIMSCRSPIHWPGKEFSRLD